MNPISPYWEGRRVAVTGAAGLIGSHLCDLLVEAGSHVLAVDDLVDAIGKAAGRSPSVRFDPSKPEGRLVKSADSTKLRRITGGIEATIPLGEGLREMVDWSRRRFNPPLPSKA